MTEETRKIITERYLGWAETWATSLSFAVTQSVEKSERIVADAIVALIAIEAEEEAMRISEARTNRFTAPPQRRGVEIAKGDGDVTASIGVGIAQPRPVSEGALRFATSIWEMAAAQAYRGFGAEAFFRMPAVARAIVILKVRARFSREQVAQVVRARPEQVDDHLENARLLFSEGRPWIEAQLAANSAAANGGCVEWNSSFREMPALRGRAIDQQCLFAGYVGHDLDADTERALHGHLLRCESCRSGFANFKRNYNDWLRSLPALDTHEAQKQHLEKITKMALKVRRRTVSDAPPVLPGLRRVWRDGQIRAMVMGAALFLIMQLWLHRHPMAMRAIRAAVRRVIGF